MGSLMLSLGFMVLQDIWTEHILTAMISYSERIQREIVKGKMCMTVQGKPHINFQDSSPNRVTRDPLHSPSRVVTRRVKSCQPGKLVEDREPRILG